jgi:precorrin-6B methylase 2
MIDRSLNYGRHLICDFLKQSHSFDTVLDIGAGTGVDLKLARDINEHCRLIAPESYASNIKTLQDNKIEVYQIDIEKESFPFVTKKLTSSLLIRF